MSGPVVRRCRWRGATSIGAIAGRVRAPLYLWAAIATLVILAVEFLLLGPAGFSTSDALAVGAAVAALALGYRHTLALRHQAARLLDEERSRQRSRDAARVHEARNAMCAIDAGVAALNHAEAFPAEVREELRQAMRTEISRLRHLVTVLTDDDSSARPSPMDLRECVLHQVALRRACGADITAELDPGATVLADETDVAGIVNNLLVNAERHGGGAAIQVTLGLDLERGEHLVVVDDAGPGIAEGDLERIFDRGFRRGPAAGDGLGLDIARSLTRAHGGRLTASRSPLGGARFELALPTLTADDERARTAAPVSQR